MIFTERALGRLTTPGAWLLVIIPACIQVFNIVNYQVHRHAVYLFYIDVNSPRQESGDSLRLKIPEIDKRHPKDSSTCCLGLLCKNMGIEEESLKVLLMQSFKTAPTALRAGRHIRQSRMRGLCLSEGKI